MLRSIKALYNYVLAAKDGETGRCKDFLLDDKRWTIRYMVADTGKWLPGRKVLISPLSLGEPDWESRLLPVLLTRKAIEDAPSLDQDAPVSRQHEIRWARHYGLPFYWLGEGLWGTADRPAALVIQNLPEIMPDETTDNMDSHLRSASEITGYKIEAADGDIGHVEDFIMDDDNWRIRYMVVDTSNWLPGRKVLVDICWINTIDWLASRIKINLSREQVKASPHYDPSAPVNREYEIRLYDFYGRPKYWE
jgi:sporulation protein YlmC with PRC-barrel domain